ncbi:MAG: DNA topoisomerase [Thermoproteota archaeon]|jgi:hypothetical protein|nr:DNA topoisomerase [Thermoproteota archaeon]
MKKRIQTLPLIKTKKSVRVTKPTKKKIKILKNELRQYLDSNGYISYSSKKKKYVILGTNSPKSGITGCPQCGIGQLMIIKSPTTKKRFIGCSNYNNGCTASSPLLQKAMLRVLKAKCQLCKWPIVVFRYAKNQTWKRQCSNIECKSRKTKISV